MKKIMSAAALMLSLTLPGLALAGADAPKAAADTKAALGQAAPAAADQAKDAAKDAAQAVKADKAKATADQAKDAAKGAAQAVKAPATPAAPAK